MPFKIPSPLDIALGKIGRNSTPAHPAFVHYPIVFLVSASLLDITSFYISFSNRNPDLSIPILTKILPRYDSSALQSISLMSYYSTVAALLTSIPTLITGIAEGYLILGQGFEFKNLDPLAKITLTHAWLNFTVVGGAVYNWLTRRSVEEYKSGSSNVIVSVLGLGALGYAAVLGGIMVYARGVGVQRMGEGLEFKQREEGKVTRNGVKGS